MRWLISAVLLAAACSDPCELEQLDECIDCGSGEIRRGISSPIDDLIDPPPVAVSVAGGVGCVMCDALHRFDARGTVVDAAGLDDPYWIAVAPDGSIYALDSFQPARRSDGYLPTSRWRVIAHDRDGGERWRLDLDEHAHPSRITADDTGPYVADDLGTLTHITAYDAATGGERWTDTGNLAVPDGAGGVYMFIESFSTEDTATLSIASFDAAHVERWRRTLTAHDRVINSPPSLEVRAAHVTTDGLAIVGRFSGDSLELGGVTLISTQDLYAGFVASLDVQGAPRWAHAFGGLNFLSELSITATAGTVVVGGRYVGEGGPLKLPATGNGELGDNGFLAAFDAQGPRRVHTFTGTDFQGIRSVIAAGDGSVWATLDTRGGFTLGSATYAGDATPRRYLINLVP